jgi:hypothetical protein
MLQALTLSRRRGECERRADLLWTINLDDVRLEDDQGPDVLKRGQSLDGESVADVWVVGGDDGDEDEGGPSASVPAKKYRGGIVMTDAHVSGCGKEALSLLPVI